jgi:CheY-like chemotaxis protein
MGLQGRLEDLPLLDMLQIIAFSRKSGFLRIAGPKGRGAVLLKEGRVLFSYSWSTLAGLETLVRHPDKIAPEVIREHIETSLRELGGLREGHFRFELADPSAADFGGIKIQPFLLQGGIDAQELLLDLAVEIDSERREATSLLELAFQGDLETKDSDTPDPETDTVALTAAQVGSASKQAPQSRDPEPTPEPRPTPSPAVSVVLVDDEAPVRSVVGAELAKKGYRVFTASNPASGAAAVEERIGSGERVIVVADLKMPSSSERTFYGGFELVRRVRRADPAMPVLLMIEGLSEKAKTRAKELGIRRMVLKPTLSKIDQDLYVADLRDFAGAIAEQLDLLRQEDLENENGARSKPGGDPGHLDFLAAMTRKLVEPGGSTDVSRLVMQVAARFLERGVLFVVKGDSARGLAAVGIGGPEGDSARSAGKVAIEISQCRPFAEAIRRGAGHRITDDLGLLDRSLLAAIGRARASEAVLIPLLFNRHTLLLLYGDNGASGRPLPDLGRLELFIAQAGMALENKLLQQKLSVADMDGAGLGQDALV